MKKKTAQIMFLFDRLYKAGRFADETRNGIEYYDDWMSSGITVGSFYDEETKLLADFLDVFPCRKYDDYQNGKKRISKLMSELYADGWVDRSIRGNQLEYMGEGQRWAYVYTMPPEFARKIRSGKTSPEKMARDYQGDKDLIKEANGWYSWYQQQEIENGK